MAKEKNGLPNFEGDEEGFFEFIRKKGKEYIDEDIANIEDGEDQVSDNPETSASFFVDGDPYVMEVLITLRKLVRSDERP